MENNNNFNEQTLNLLSAMLDIDTLEAQIQLLDDVMDDYLDVSPDIISNEEAAHRLDVASNLRRMSKNSSYKIIHWKKVTIFKIVIN